MMVNSSENVESAKETYTSIMSNTEEEGAGLERSVGGRIQRPRRFIPRRNSSAETSTKSSIFPIVQCKLPLDRISDIISKIRKTKMINPTSKNKCLPDTNSSESDNPSVLCVKMDKALMSTNPEHTADISDIAPRTDRLSNLPARTMCLFCDRTFVNGVLLQKHTERIHHISTNRRSSMRNAEMIFPPNFHPGCNMCNKNNGVQTATNLPVLFNHLMDEHSVKYFACRLCKERFSTPKILLCHNRNVHGLEAEKNMDEQDQLTSKCLRKGVGAKEDGYSLENSIVNQSVPQSTSSPINSESSQNLQNTQSECSDNDLLSDVSKKILPTTKMKDLASGSSLTENIHSKKVLKGKSLERKATRNSKNQSTVSRNQKIPTIVSRNSKYPCIELRNSKIPCPEPNTNLIHLYAKSFETKTLSKKKISSDSLKSDKSSKDPSVNEDFIDFEDNIVANLIIPSERVQINKKNGLDQSAVIILDDINLDKNLFKFKDSINPVSRAPLKPDANDNQILSRLGVTQNRSPRARSLRRSQKAPATENRASSETCRKDKSKIKNDSNDFVINKSRNDPNSKFDPDFYSNVGSNVRENLMKFLDGKLGMQNTACDVPELIDPKIRSTHAIIPAIPIQPAEIHGSDVSLNAITVFPTLLTSDQYGSDKVPHYSYGAKVQTFKKIVTKNSWKWKWDPIKKYKYCNEDGKIVRKLRQLQQISPRDLSKLDIWTQLSMREKYDTHIVNKELVSIDSEEEKSRCERQRQINELNTILDKRVFPEIEMECLRYKSPTNFSQPTQVESISADVIQPPQSCVTKSQISESGVLPESSENDESVLSSLGLVSRRKVPFEGQSTEVLPVLSGEWARPRCYVCCVCGRRTDCLRLLEAHQAARHPHVHATHYELVGQELLQKELYKHLYLPGIKRDHQAIEKNKLRKESIARQIKKIPRRIINRSTRILRTTTRKIKSSERECTKCKKMLTPSELYRHVLECAGDYGWIMAKKKCKYKPFGARKRRLKGLYKRERPQEDDGGELKDRATRPKVPSRPRIKPSDAETIQRMLANLPAKRASRQILDLPCPKIRGHLKSDNQTHVIRRVLPSKSNLQRQKVLSTTVITTLKSGLGKKVRRITRSVANNMQALRQRKFLISTKKEIQSNENTNSPKRTLHLKTDSQTVDKDISKDVVLKNINIPKSPSKSSKRKVPQVISKEQEEPSIPQDQEKISFEEKNTRNRSKISKNEIPSVHKDLSPDKKLKKKTRTLRRRPDIISNASETLHSTESVKQHDVSVKKMIKKPDSKTLKPTKNKGEHGKEDKELEVVDLEKHTNSVVVSTGLVNISTVDEQENPLLPKQKSKKSKKKAIGFPLKWISSKRMRLTKSKNKLTTCEDDENVAVLQESVAEEVVKTSSSQNESMKLHLIQDMDTVDIASKQCTEKCELFDSNPQPINKMVDSPILKISNVGTDNIEELHMDNSKLFKESSSSQNLNPLNNIENMPLLAQEDAVQISEASYRNVSSANFPSMNNSQTCNSGNTDNHKQSQPTWKSNSTQFLKELDTDILNMSKNNLAGSSTTYTQLENTVISNNVIEPSRMLNNEYNTINDKIDKPPLYQPQLYNLSHEAESKKSSQLENTANMRLGIFSHCQSDAISDNESRSLAKAKQSKSKRGLNDCIAMLKGKLTEKISPVDPISTFERSTPENTNMSFSLNEEDSQQPLDLSGRIPQAEDLSLKTSKALLLHQKYSKPKCSPSIPFSKNINPVKSPKKPIFDPTLRIPQYSVNHMSKSNSVSVQKISSGLAPETSRKVTQDFSIPSLLIPDQKRYSDAVPDNTLKNIDLPQLRYGLSLLQPTLVDTIEKLPPDQREEIVKALPQVFAQAVENLQSKRSENSGNTRPVNFENKQSNPPVNTPDMQNLTITPIRPVSPDKINIDFGVKTLIPQTSEISTQTVILNKENITEKCTTEYENVNTDLFLIDPVTGMITERANVDIHNTNIGLSDDTDVIPIVEVNKINNKSLQESTDEVIDLTDEPSNVTTQDIPSLLTNSDTKTVSNDSQKTASHDEGDLINTEISVDKTFVETAKIDSGTASLRAVRIKSATGKRPTFDLPQTEETVLIDLSENQDEVDQVDLPSTILKIHSGDNTEKTTEIIHPPSFVESTTPSKDVCNELVSNDQPESNLPTLHIENLEKEPAIQQDEVSSTQHSTVDESADCQLVETAVCKEIDCSTLESTTKDTVNKHDKPMESSKPIEINVGIINEQIGLLDERLNPFIENTLEKPKRILRNSHKAEMLVDKVHESDGKIGLESVLPSKKRVVTPKKVKTLQVKSPANSKVPLNDDADKKTTSTDNIKNLEKSAITNDEPFKKSEMSPMSENVQKVSFNKLLMEENNTISETALTPSNVTEYQSDSKNLGKNDKSDAIDISKIQLGVKEETHVRRSLRKNKNKPHIKDINKNPDKNRNLASSESCNDMYLNPDVSGSAIIPGESCKANLGKSDLSNKSDELNINTKEDTKETIFSSDNEESDDDICLAVVAKKKMTTQVFEDNDDLPLSMEITSLLLSEKIVSVTSKKMVVTQQKEDLDKCQKIAYSSPGKIQSRKPTEKSKTENTIQISPSRLTRAQNLKHEKRSVVDIPTDDTIQSSVEVPATESIGHIVLQDDNEINKVNCFPLKKRKVISSNIQLTPTDDIKKPENTRKSGRLSVYKEKFSHISDDKIATINSVKLSDNGHLIFKMQKENNRSNECTDNAILPLQKSSDCTKKVNVKMDCKKSEKSKRAPKTKGLVHQDTVQDDPRFHPDTTNKIFDLNCQDTADDISINTEKTVRTVTKKIKKSKASEKKIEKKLASPLKDNSTLVDLFIVESVHKKIQHNVTSSKQNSSAAKHITVKEHMKQSDFDDTVVEPQVENIFLTTKKTRSSKHSTVGSNLKLSPADEVSFEKTTKEKHRNLKTIQKMFSTNCEDSQHLIETVKSKSNDDISSQSEDKPLELDSNVSHILELVEKFKEQSFPKDIPNKINKKLNMSSDTDSDVLSPKIKVRNNIKVKENKQIKKRSLRYSERHAPKNLEKKEVFSENETDESFNNNIQENIPLSEISKICRLQKKENEHNKFNNFTESIENTSMKESPCDVSSQNKKKSNKNLKILDMSSNDSHTVTDITLSNVVSESVPTKLINTVTDEFLLHETDLKELNTQSKNTGCKKINKTSKKNKIKLPQGSLDTEDRMSREGEVSEKTLIAEKIVCKTGNYKKSSKPVLSLNASCSASDCNSSQIEKEYELDTGMAPQNIIEDTVINIENFVSKPKQGTKLKLKLGKNYSTPQEEKITDEESTIINEATAEDGIITRYQNEKNTKSKQNELGKFGNDKAVIESSLINISHPTLNDKINCFESESDKLLTISNQLESKDETLTIAEAVKLNVADKIESSLVSSEYNVIDVGKNESKKKSKKEKKKRSVTKFLVSDTINESICDGFSDNTIECHLSPIDKLPLSKTYKTDESLVNSDSKPEIDGLQKTFEREVDEPVIVNISKATHSGKSKKKSKNNESLKVQDSTLNIKNIATNNHLHSPKNCHVELIIMKDDPRNGDLFKQSVEKTSTDILNEVEDNKCNKPKDTHVECKLPDDLNTCHENNTFDVPISEIGSNDKKVDISTKRHSTLRSDLIKHSQLDNPNDQAGFSGNELNSTSSTISPVEDPRKLCKTTNAKNDTKKNCTTKLFSPSNRREVVKKSVDFSETSDIKKLPVQARRISNRRQTLASCEYIENTAKDEDSLLQDKYLADFGMFTEKRPRKSTIMAIKKISQTFKPDSSDTDDVDVQSNLGTLRRSSRPQKKRLRKTSLNEDVSSDKSITKESSDTSPVSNKAIEIETITHDLPQENSDDRISLNILSDSIKDSKEEKLETYCTICKKKFRRPENLQKHKMTLMHISKLSEIEAKEMAPKYNDEGRNSSPTNSIPKSSHDHSRSNSSMSKGNANNDISCNEESVPNNSSVKAYKSLAERKSFENESTLLLQKETSSLVLQEDTKTIEEKDDYQVILEKNEDLSWKKLSRDEALFFECCSLLKESDTSRKQSKVSDVYKTIPKSSKYPSPHGKHNLQSSLHTTSCYDDFEQDSVKNVETKSPKSENISKDLDSFSEDLLPKKNTILETNTLSTTAESFPYECDKNSDFDIDCEQKKCDSIDGIIESLSNCNEVEEVCTPNVTKSFNVIDHESDKPQGVDGLVYKEKTSSLSLSSFITEKHIDCSEHDPYSAESLMARNNSDEFSENGDSIISNPDTVQHSIESLNKNMYSEKSTDYINQLNEFEDKFDKIKRKAREKAQAAQEAMAAVLTPRLHSKKSKKRNHCKSRRSGKQDTGFKSKSSKRISKHGQSHKKKINFTTAQKMHSKKVMTKGALKGFDGVKVSIPTQEINLHDILETKTAGLEFNNDLKNFMSDNTQRTIFQTNQEDAKNILDENVDCNKLLIHESKLGSNDKKKKSSQFNEEDCKEHTTKKVSLEDDSNGKHQLDIYEFFDDEDENNVSDNFKFRTPVILTSKEKSSVSSSKRLSDNFTNSSSTLEKSMIETQNEDSQISSLSFSDRDEFMYMSDDYIGNNSEEETNLSSNSVERGVKINRKHAKLQKVHKNIKKNAIMGKIFKNNAIRNDQKCLKETVTENFSKETSLAAHTDMDELFDSLLEKNPTLDSHSITKESSKNITEEIDFYNEPDNEVLESTNQRPPAASASTFEYLSEDYETDDESRVNARIRQRKIVPRLKARSTDDESSINVSSKVIAIHSEKSLYNKCERRVDIDFYKDNIGVASRKSQRKCTTGKQNVLVESWSSESDFEDFRQFEEYSSIPRSQRHHRRPRRSGRHRPADESKLSSDLKNDMPENYNIPDLNSEVTDSTELKDMVDYTPTTDEKFDDVHYSSKKRKKQRSIHANQLRIQQKTLRISSGLHQARRVSFNTLNHSSKVPGSRRRRRQSQKPFDYDDEFKPARIAEPLTTERRNKRTASEMLYYWSSSSDDDVSYAAVDTSSREPEPIEQHGWIVGDSHKKLVTMLAHAKGRKLDDNTSVKEKKPRPSV